MTHPIYGDDNIFDSWLVLCEVTCELAEQYVLDNKETILAGVISKLSDEMLETAEEYES